MEWPVCEMYYWHFRTSDVRCTETHCIPKTTDYNIGPHNRNKKYDHLISHWSISYLKVCEHYTRQISYNHHRKELVKDNYITMTYNDN